MLQQLPRAEPTHPAHPKPTHAPRAPPHAQTLPRWDLDSSRPECLWALCSGSSRLWLLSPAELNTHPCDASGSGSGLETEPCVLAQPRWQSATEEHRAMLAVLLRLPKPPHTDTPTTEHLQRKTHETQKRHKKCGFLFPYKAGQKDGK